MVCFAFFALLRECEVLPLKMEDLTFHTRSMYVKVRRAKKGGVHFVQVKFAEFGEVSSVFISALFLLRDKYGSSAFLFPGNRGHLSTGALTNAIRLLALYGNVSKVYSSHSCRRGGASFRAVSGQSPRRIAEVGNWQSYSSFARYIDSAVLGDKYPSFMVRARNYFRSRRK